ncbi:DUF6270 domain-containing protein [Isoptericola rhizosphaerae]|uniref:DUF6270 domain-containing protein n=1 Tax=Isoptericola rhizosphaerae TaxID=3377837 RepID=UPI00383A96BB
MRVFIHGSCVSRDLLSLLPPEEFALTFYSPRQSIIPLLGHITGLDEQLDKTRLTSRFQRRAITGTLHADLIQQLQHHHRETDLVLWDITDERLGVYEKSGRYMTRTLEAISTGLDSTLASTARHIPFGTDEHFELWASALQKWERSLTRSRLADRVVLLAPRWASRLDDGTPTPSSFGTHAADHNLLARRYYELARATMAGARIIGDGIDTRSAPDHRWGPAPFHFNGETNASLGDVLHELVYDHSTQFPPPRPVVATTGPHTIDVKLHKTWAEEVALHVLLEGKPKIRFRYQKEDLFRAHLPAAGKYVLRGYHRARGYTVGVNSEHLSTP